MESLDLFPTLVDYCQPKDQKLNHKLDGLSLKNLLEGKSSSIKEAAKSYWGKRVSIRTKTHRLIIDGKNHELYQMDGVFTDGKNIADKNSELIKEILKLK